MIKNFLIVFITTSIVCPIINYTYLFLSFKFKFHKEFVKWIMDDAGYCAFITPFMSQVSAWLIFIYVSYRLLLRPLFYLVVTLPLKGFELLSEILFKPIKKMQFIDELDSNKHI